MACGAKFDAATGAGGIGGAGGVVTSGAGAMNGTGGGGGGETEVARCATTPSTDDFDDQALDEGWDDWADPGASVSEGSGVFRLHMQANYATYAGVFTLADFTFADCWISVEVPVPPSDADGEFVNFRVGPSNDDVLFFSQNDVALDAVRRDGGVDTPVATMDFDAGSHRYLRLRESGGVTYYETRGDAASWSTFAQTPTPSPGVPVVAWLQGGRWRSDVGVARELAFDKFNLIE